MNEEIEIKIKVDSLDPIRERLICSGTIKKNVGRERDVYYYSPSGKSNEIGTLRIRERYNPEYGPQKSPSLLIWKSQSSDDSNILERAEIHTEISSIKDCQLILDRLGYRCLAILDRKRERFKDNDLSVTVLLDDIKGLGTYIEIEAFESLTEEESVNAIHEAIVKFNIKGEVSNKSYLQLMLEYLDKNKQ